MQLSAFFAAFAVSSCLCLISTAASPRLSRWIRRNDLAARQASHDKPALRLGGIGLVIGVLASALLTEGHGVLLFLLLCAAPIFVSGLLEDLGYSQSPRTRLLMAVASGAIVIMLTGKYLTSIGIAPLDAAFAYAPVAIAFTLFATSGLVHATNLIDGLNGLAGAATLIGTMGLALLADQAGSSLMDMPAPILIGAILGFLLLNYPFGRIFLGDAGAYTLGFVLAWLSVSLLSATPDLSPWAIALVFFWPVTDTLLAMWRRHQTGYSIGHADRLHFHQVVMRAMEIRLFNRKLRRLSNPATTALLAPLMALPGLAGVALWNTGFWAAIAFLACATLFVGAYFTLILIARQGRMPLGGRNQRLTSRRKPKEKRSPLTKKVRAT